MKTPKQQIADLFSKAAKHYDTYAGLQFAVGQRLLSEVQAAQNDKNIEVFLDIGCGTGRLSALCQQQLAVQQFLGIDLAVGMVAEANKILSNSGICADAEALPIANESINVAFSNLTIQWCENVRNFLQEASRVLQKSGSVYFSTLLAGSLIELKTAWAKIDQVQHINNFLEKAELLQYIKTSGFNITFFEEEHRIQYYPSVMTLLKNLKAIGANFHPNESIGLYGKKKLQAMLDAYELTQDGYPLSYQIAYVGLQKC